MADIQIKVAPQVMRRQANDFGESVSKIRTCYESLKRTAEATKGSWVGDAANAYRSYVKKIDKDVQEILKRLGEHPVDLLKMAELYDAGEQKAAEIASSLPTDVIS